jgi:hypothetical protein
MAVPMPAMHEDVHQWASQKHQVGKRSQCVSSVLLQEIEACHKEKAVESDIGPAPWRPMGEKEGSGHGIFA